MGRSRVVPATVPLALAVAAAAILAVALGAPPQELCTSPGERCPCTQQALRPATMASTRPSGCVLLATPHYPHAADHCLMWC